MFVKIEKLLTRSADSSKSIKRYLHLSICGAIFFLGSDTDKSFRRSRPPHSPKNKVDSDSENSVIDITDTKKNKSKSNIKRNKISAARKYFTRSTDKKFVKCTPCCKEYKTGGNTSNLKRFQGMNYLVLLH